MLHAKENYAGMLPHLQGQSSHNRRLRRLGERINWLVGTLAGRNNICFIDL